jgi:hypothetical protein
MQETCLGNRSKFKVPGYTAARADKLRHMAGLVTLVKTNITYHHTIINISNIDAQAVAITCLNTTLVVVNIYRPPTNTLLEKDLQRLSSHPTIRDYLHKIYCGDFNGHNPIWGSKRLSIPGLEIEKWAETDGLIILNDHSYTWESPTSKLTSSIDLTITTPDLAAKANWHVDYTTRINSDHYPVITTIDIRPARTTTARPKNWIMDDTDWKQYVRTLDKTTITDIPHHDPDIYCKNMTDNILEAADSAIPKTSGKIPRRDPTPWWNKDCGTAVRNKERAYTKLRFDRTQEHRIQYRLTVQHAKDTIKLAKTHNWNKFIDTVDRRTTAKHTWQQVKRMRGARNASIPVLNKTAYTDKQKADLLADTFTRNNSSTNHTPTFSKSKTDLLKQQQDHPPPPQPDNPDFNHSISHLP